MKKIALITLMLCSVCFGVDRGRYDYSADWVELERNSNSILISPSDNIATKYAWLVSSDRDSQMGALSETNHRTLVLSPGTYTLTATLTLNTSFVDIIGLTGNTKDVTISRTHATQPVVKQTGLHVILKNFSIVNGDGTGGPSLVIQNQATGTCGLLQDGSTQYIYDLPNDSFSDVCLTKPVRPDEVFLWKNGELTPIWAKFYRLALPEDTPGMHQLTTPAGTIESGVNYIYVSMQSEYHYIHLVGESYSLGFMGGYWNHCSGGLGYHWHAYESTYTAYNGASDGVLVNLNGKAVTDETGGLVSIPITGHTFRNNDHIFIDDAGNKYDGNFIISDASNADKIIFKCAYQARTFGVSDKLVGYTADCHPIMVDCTGMERCFGGDHCRDVSGTFTRCTNIISGGFGGCGEWGSPCSGTFIECVNGDKGFALNARFSGTAIRCTSGDMSFGGSNGTTLLGYETAGRIEECRITALSNSLYLCGAKIYNSYIQVTGTDKDCLYITDSLSEVYGNTLISNGSGNCIDAGSALNVKAAHNRSNADKGENVTNLLGAGTMAGGFNIVDSDISF